MDFIIREIIKEDSNFLYDLYLSRNPEDVLNTIKKEEQDIFIFDYLSQHPSHPFQKWYIIEHDSKNIGALTLHKHNNELGYWIIPNFQGKGIGYEAIEEFMKITEKEFFTIKAHKNNTRSQHIAEKLGFQLSHYYYTYKKNN